MNSKTEDGKTLRGARGVLFFFARFLAASVILYLVYIKFGAYYMRLVAYGAKPMLAPFHYRLVMDRALAVTEEISLNPVVFFSLLIAFWHAPAKVMLRAAVAGFLVLTAANSMTVFLSFLSFYRGSERLWTGTEFFNLTINFFLPLLLWFVLLPIRSSILPERRAGG
jgi:hypothetical protein